MRLKGLIKNLTLTLLFLGISSGVFALSVFGGFYLTAQYYATHESTKYKGFQ